MQQPLPFDPNVYFGYVAENLLKNLGDKALVYADHALKKMRSIGDHEGFDLWLSIHQHLIEQSCTETRGTDVTLH
ncbi:hypothetical protein [Kordiimonas sp. SCSIO 12610]|uniref:hypothetical protein n=1 Tax=Kordiimonas sp. SCSIO 12610 TaxID=2829597 RepID=UPI00210A2D60|nr:hypothetical protein [Kordiimonas sp. SCSIO 12610]UTW55201.1 hypothetical protein KFF44_15575 [Kordiimonas sp. SCSIO 12610]